MVKIHKNVYEQIFSEFTSHAPECGGVLGAMSDGDISEFYFDISGKSTEESYTPDYIKINEILENDWAKRGVQMIGIVHSHGNAGDFPSCGDIYYCEQIMKNANIREFILPIATVNPFTLHMYVVTYNGKEIFVKKDDFEIVD